MYTKLKYDFCLELPLNENLCELVGAFIGDGFVAPCGNGFQFQITGDKVLDREYYHSTLTMFCQELFDISPRIAERTSGIFLNVYSKQLYKLFTSRFGFPSGKKCYTVAIPAEILDADIRLICATLRGMFDTDGGVAFDKRNCYRKPYVRISYTSASPKLIVQISKILYDIGIPHSMHGRKDSSTQQIQINGVNNVKQFVDTIGFSNSRHITKLKLVGLM